MSNNTIGKPFGGISSTEKLVMGSSDIIIPQECILLWLGYFSSSIPYSCTSFTILLPSCKLIGFFAKTSNSSLGNPNTFPTSRKIDRYLNSTLVPQKATCSAPYRLKIYSKMVSRSFHDQSISKSGGLFRLTFKNRSKYKSNSIGQISVIPRQ